MTSGDCLADLFPAHEVEERGELEEAEDVEQIEDLFAGTASASVVSPEQPRPTSSRPRPLRQTPPASPITVHSDSESSEYAPRRSTARRQSGPARATRSARDPKGKGKAVERRRTRRGTVLEVSDGDADSTVYGTDGTESSGIQVISVRRRPATRPIWKDTLVVEIPLKPLEEIQRYSLHESIDPPSRASRRRLADMDDESDYTSSSPIPLRAWTPTKPPARRPRWKVKPSPSINGDTDIMDGVFESASDQGGSRAETSDDGSEDMGDSESDGVALRRSKRARRTLRHDPSSSSRPSTRQTRSRGQPIAHSRTSRLVTPMKPEKRANWKTHSDDEFEEEIEEEDEEERSQYSEGEEEIDELDDEYQLESSGSSQAAESESESENSRRTEDFLGKHRQTCEKCQRPPASVLLERSRRLKKKPGKKRKRDEDEISDEELAEMLDGWLQCTKCVISSHWGCLGPQQQKDVLAALALEEGPPIDGGKPRKVVEIDETYEFTCSRCSTNPSCLVCHQEKVDMEGTNGKDQIAEPGEDGDVEMKDDSGDVEMKDDSGDVEMKDGSGDVEMKDDSGDVEMKRDSGDVEIKDDSAKPPSEEQAPLLFRCLRCKQACHYEHLKNPFDGNEDPDLNDIAAYYQQGQKRHDQWFCHQCHEWIWAVDIICAWRPWPADAKEAPREPHEKPSWKDPLPREYLVKWVGRGFRHATWVTHPWLAVTTGAKLRFFLEKGPALNLITDETLAARGDEMARPTIANVMEEEDAVSKREKHGKPGAAHDEWEGHGPAPDPDAESSIPQEWKTVDRVLDVFLLPPAAQAKNQKGGKGQAKRKAVSGSATPSHPGSEPPDTPADPRPDGIEPLADQMMSIEEWEKATGRVLTEEDADEVASKVTWCFVKWDDLQYDQSCWDTPPPVDSILYPPFKRALRKYLGARRIFIPVLTPKDILRREEEATHMRAPPNTQPDCIVGGTLMQFQMEGFQWLLFKHFKRESCILADDMGLGKTIQIASLLGYLGSKGLDIYPMLVIVPNSTITNWVREFEKWVPHMRVVPYYGEKASRKIISKYELYHPGLQNKAAGLKAHVVLTTYDTITSNDFRVFSGIPRWELLCVDEGQRLKSDSNLIFNRLKTLNSVHRILLTGTPLNNNLRELFNLLNFLDAQNFSNLADLEARFANLNEGLVQELHALIKPYILRRIKADVLKLPPKIEIIVPISLTPLQKNVYKTILEKNVDVLKAIAEARRRRAKKPVTIEGGEVVVSKKKEKEKEEEAAAPPAAVADVPTSNSAEVANKGNTVDVLEVERNGHSPNGAVANGVSGDKTPNGTSDSSPTKEILVVDGEAAVDASASLTTAPAEQSEQPQAEQPVGENNDGGGSGGSKET